MKIRFFIQKTYAARTLLSTLVLSFLLSSPLTISQIYKFIDENGNLVYSDTPPADRQDMEPAELPEVFFQPAVDVPDRPISEEIKGAAINVSIQSPVQDATILGSQADFVVSA